MAVAFDHERSRLLKTYRIKLVRFKNCTVFKQTDLVIGQMQSYFTQ
jgi:very-short-patch-repair endonuclease